MLKLNKVRDIKAKISILEQKLTCFRAMTLKPPIIDGMPKSRSRTSVTERLAVQILDTERELSILRAELETEKAELGVAILDKVKEPLLAAVLILYYVACETYQTIADKLQTSRRTVYRYMDKARAEFHTAL